MQKSFVLMLLLLTAALLTASTVETGPTGRVVPPWQSLWEGLEPVNRGQSTGTGSIIKTDEQDRACTDAGGTGTPSEFDDPNGQQPPQDWGNDVLVGERVQETSGRISVDNDNLTGDIYVCMLNRDATTADTAHIWRSTDGGLTWQTHWDIIGNSSIGDLNDAQILCGHGPGDTTWLYIVSAASGLGLRIRRSTPDTSDFHWVTIDTATNIRRVAVDRNIENPEHIFCAWERTDGHLYIMSSTDAGATWGNRVYVNDDSRGTSLAAGGDGYGYLAYLGENDSTYVEIGRFKNNLVTPNWKFSFYVDSGYNRRFREIAIAADRTAPGDSQVAIALSTYRISPTNVIGPRYAWTLNGGVSWSSSFWPVTNQSRETWLARFPRIRRPYDSPGFRAIVSMPETTTAWDTIVYAYTTANDPTNWINRGEYNDYRNTGEVSHDIGFSSLTSGGFITYRQYGSGRVWFDGYNNYTGIGAGPTPVQTRRMTTVFGGGATLTLSRRSQVKASVYDQNGRLVRELFNGTMEAGEHRLDPGVTSGVRFLRVTVDGKTETAKLIRLQ
jgi:hypothetical protein